MLIKSDYIKLKSYRSKSPKNLKFWSYDLDITKTFISKYLKFNNINNLI